MSDLFSFQSDDINSKKFKSNTEIDPLLFSSKEGSVDVYIVLDHSPPVKFLYEIKNYLKGNFPNVSYKILSALPFKPTEKDLKKSIIELYGLNSIDLKKYIPSWSKVITVGRGLYSVTKSEDLAIEGFYDTIQWKTSFFAPEIKSQVFPVPNYFSWLGKDTFENFFVLKQIELALKYELKPFRIPAPKLELVDSPNEHLIKWKDYNGITAWDLETKFLDPWNPESKIICLTCAYAEERKDYKAYYLPFNKIDINLLSEWFKSKKLVGNNLKYDVRWQRIKNLIPRENIQVFWDNMKGSHAINEMQYNSLKSDAWLYTPFGGYDFDLELYKIKYPKCKDDYSLIPQSVMLPYATTDSLVSLLCYYAQQIEIDALDKICKIDTGWSIRRSMEEIAIPAINAFADIEINGMCYDWKKLDILSKELQEEINKRSIEIRKILSIPDSINIDSNDQLGKFLESKGWEDPGRSEKGFYLTNDESMTYWKKKGHKEVQLIQEYTECITIMKTFVGVEKNKKGEPTGFYQYRKSDGKVHGSFATMMADSWRGKSYDPNLQNIVKNSTVKLNGVYLHERVRECFNVPDEDYVISENDAAGLQLRIGATMSNDKVMRDIFTKYGGDMHSISGNSVFCPEVPLNEFLKKKKEEPYKKYRRKAKAVNFSLEFGSAAYSFAQSSLMAEWTLDEAKEYVEEHKLGDRQRKLFQVSIKDVEINKEIKDKKCYIQDQLDFSYYWASAEDIRNKFFKTYKGLEEWHKKQHAFAKKNGYIQSLWGPIRRLPFLIYVGKNDDRGRTKNYENICLNSPVQNFEAMYMMYNISRLHKEMVELGLKSYIIGNVHDSFIMYLHRTEFGIISNLVEKYFHEVIPELMNGIPYVIELGYSDYIKGEYWGIKENEFPKVA